MINLNYGNIDILYNFDILMYLIKLINLINIIDLDIGNADNLRSFNILIHFINLIHFNSFN